MKRFIVLFTLTLCLLPGCRQGLDAPADIDTAESALRTVLQAWKAGKSQAELEREDPSLLMNDDDWRTEKRLLDFTMEKGGLVGRQIQWRVKLKLKHKDGKIEDRAAVYVIDTTPRIVIVRDSFAS